MSRETLSQEHPMSVEEVDAAAAGLGAKVERSLNTTTVRVEPGKVRAACSAISSVPGLYHLSTITAVDLGGSVELLYHFWKGRSFVTVKTDLPKESLVVDSVSGILASATLYEAEIQDLFGVKFDGNPYTGRRLLLPDDYPADAPPPLRAEADPEKIRRMMKLE